MNGALIDVSPFYLLTFSGKGIPPKRLGSSDEVKKYVSGNSDGIGYIDRAAVDASVKVVLTLN